MSEQKGTGLNIKAVAERTGVSLHTLRAWERRYGIPRPERHADNRYRLYDEQDMADVLWMKRQVDAGVSPAQASALLRQQPREEVRARIARAEPLVARQDALYDALVRGDDTSAQQILNEALSAMAPEMIVLEILQPTLRRIGEAWQRNILSVEQEHFASNLVRQRLDALMYAQPPLALTAPRLVATCAPEEQHDLGLLMLTWLARRRGWNVNYLGQRTPLAEMERAGRNASVIVVSVTTVTGLASLVPLWSEPIMSAPLLFGGNVFHLLPRLSEHVPGAYLGVDAAEAMQRLATTSPRAVGWKPARRMLKAALALEASRYKIVGATTEQFAQEAAKGERARNSERARKDERARDEIRRRMEQPAMFLTDAVVSALAFDVPELMDLQGAWARDFFPAHEISTADVDDFLEGYRVMSARFVPAEAAKLAGELIARLRGSVEAL